MKKIEWNKETPRFYELKNRIQEFGVPHDWCVEVMRGSHFISPDENVEICGDRITMQAAPISDDPIFEEQHEDPQFSRWLKQSFEKVIGHVGRVFLCDTSKPNELVSPIAIERYVGTAGLMDDQGASLCALHTIFNSIEDPSRYKIHVVYPNYHQGQLAFEAKVKNMDDNVDMCLLEPAKPLTKPWIPLTYLDLATDAREGDFVYCFFYPKDPSKHQTLELFEKIMKPNKPTRIWRATASSSTLADHPTIISGSICFSDWMQGVASYNHLPDSNGGLLVSRSGRVKGIHVKAFSCGELQTFLRSKNPDEIRIAKKLSKTMNIYAPWETLPVFVPPHGLVRMLQLQGGFELLQVALLQNKELMNVEKNVDSQKCSKISKRKCPFKLRKKLLCEKKLRR
jgi:hypothetical protein